MFLKINLTLILLIFSTAAQANDLDHYRLLYTDQQNAANLKDASALRTQNIRVGLGTAENTIDGWDSSWSLVNNRDNRLSSSSFIKLFAREAQVALRFFDLYEAPMVFDPSDFADERKVKYEAAATKKFKELLSNMLETPLLPTFSQQLDSFVYEYNEKVVKKDSSKDVSCDALPEVNPMYGSDLLDSHGPAARVLSDYIANKAPTYLKQETENETTIEQTVSIFDILGHIRRVDVADGRVKRLKVTTCIKAPYGSKVDLVDANETTLSLGILINIVTGYDKYYVDTNKYLINLLIVEIEPLLNQSESYYGAGSILMSKADKARLKIYEDVIKHMKKKLAGAEFIHKQLMSLSTDQQKFLLDMFLQLKGTDIPTDKDLALFSSRQELQAKAKCREAGISSDDECVTYLKDFDIKEFDTDHQTQQADFLYYKGLDTDLGFLETFIQEEKDNNQAVEDVITNMRNSQ